MLKKMIIFPCCLLFVISVYSFNNNPLFSRYAEKFEIYLLNASSTAQIVQVSEKEFKSFKGIKGESCKIKDEEFSIKKFFSEFNATIIFEEKTNFGISYYGFSPTIKYKKEIHNKIINLHVFVGESEITVGSPIIFGSF